MSEKLKVQQDMTTKFKVGDCVRMRADAENMASLIYGPLVGRVGVVQDVFEDASEELVKVDFDDLTIYARRFDLVEPAFEQVLATAADPDLGRGYAEECSAYRACQNEKGGWIIEAVRVKIVAQCADEAEANRIARALNSTININD